jgi:hypothetical protein
MKIFHAYLVGMICLGSTPGFCQSVASYTSSLSETDRMSLIKTNIPLTEWHENSFWPQYSDYRDEIRDVATREYAAVQELANTTTSVSNETALNNGNNLISFRLKELEILRRHHAAIGLTHNGIIALKFLQTESMLDMMESARAYEQTALGQFQFHNDGELSGKNRQAKYNTLLKALSLSSGEDDGFLKIYKLYEQECDELLGERYNLYSLFAGDPSDFAQALAKRQGYDLIVLMEREVRLKEKYFKMLSALNGPVVAARFLAWEDYYSLKCKLAIGAEK